MATTAQQSDRDTFGVLVGWSHGEFADKLDLRLQTAQSAGRLASGEIDNLHVVMTPQQATQLANYLFTVTRQTAPRPRKRGLMARWFGG